MMAPTPGPIPGTLGQVVGEPQDSPAFMMNPRKSMTVSTKGLLNMPGQNNCFLNSAVQVLWHLDTFRRNFRELSGHACMAESCIFCALKELFTQFQDSQESALPPDALRHALAKTFCDQRRFQLGFMDDAAECFENILLRIHVHIANQESEDMCSNSNCIPHQKFAMTLVEQRICYSCGARSDPLPFTQMVHYVTTSALCAKAMEKKNMDLTSQTPVSFGSFLRLAGDMGEVRDCPSNCGSKVQVKRTLMNHPEVVSIGLVWDSESPTLQHITDVFHSLGMFLQLQDMFHYVYDGEWASNTTHQLVGVVTYYGKHYSTFFFHTKLKIWIYFDDAAVREIGPSWEQVVEKCQRGRFQPLLLLFANPESSMDNDHPRHFASRQNDLKKTPFINQRQAVINNYLQFQNSFTNAKFDYNRSRNIPVHNPILEPYLNGTYRNGDNGLPIYQNTSHLNAPFSYNQGPQNGITNGGHPPVYSNLQYLNSLQHKDQTDLAKLNEVSLPLVAPLPSLKSYDSVNNSEVLLEKIDFDAAKDSDSAFTEEDPEGNDMYISRKTVENVLNQQKRQMSLCRSYSQSSVGNRNSSSSLESFDNIQPNKLGPIKSQLPDNIPNRRDSGSWSSDRNSCSSNNSGENPFLTMVTSKRLLLGLNKKSQLPDYSNTNTSDHGYDSYSVSSSDSYPSVNGSPVKLDPRMTQIPEDWQPEEEDNDLEKKLKLVTEDSSGPPDCDKLCAESDLLLAKSLEKEKDGDLVMAALLCDSAAARARAAMEAPYNNSRSLVSAKMKHSTCVMRSSNLYRRLKDHEMDERRKQKGHSGHHSRQSSRDSTHSKHSRQSSKDSTHSKAGSKEGSPNSDEADSFGKNIEIYGTLPKKGSRKKNAATSNSLKTKDDQVYKDFLDKQRKNTSLAESLSETMMKNVDISHSAGESNSKPKSSMSPEKSHKKSYTEGVTPKSPTRKKVDTPLRNADGGKKTQKPVEPLSVKNTGVEISSRDLLSPITSPDKKQHKIKRKLMGGFMKRKNRSLPDLREDQDLSDRVDCFLDDAIIKVPTTMMLPNGKAKKIEKSADAGIGSMTRGFHQPHHAFVKKDLTQRPLLMKVNPPNIQPSVLTSPKSKLVHTLPSIPKKLQEPNAKLESPSNGITKPSKIPFISTFPKCEPTNLPPLSPPKSIESKIISKAGILSKTSAIPVLTPQVSLASLRAVNLIKDEPVPEINKLPQTSENQPTEKDDLPQPSNPFLAEIQAKRQQVLSKAQKEDNTEPIKNSDLLSQMNDNKELSMLPKLARNAEGTSWLRELQSKQQQLLNKHDNLKGFTKPVNGYDIEASKPPVIAGQDIKQESKQSIIDSHGWKFPAEILSENTKKEISIKSESSSDSKTTSSVKDIASRFEKVLKMPQQATASPENVELGNFNSSTKSPDCTEIKDLGNKFLRTETDVAIDKVSLANPCLRNNLPLKSALKAWTDFNSSNDTVDSKFQSYNASDCDSFQEKTTVKPILKQDVSMNSTDLASELTNSNILRPMQPPDYATAMQRLELIRTSTNDTNLLPVEQTQIIPDAPKKKQGPKKTVTFSDKVVLVACAEYDEIDFSSNPLFERVYQQHVESGKGEIPILSSSYNPHGFGRTMHDDSVNDSNLPSSGLSSCNLCHNKQVTPPNSYCTDCEFYLSRFKP